MLALVTGCNYLGSGSLDRDGDGIDDILDCDSLTPGAAERSTWIEGWSDHDGDGFGAGTSVLHCHALPPGTAANADDCDDEDADVHPGALERCAPAGVDEDCDGRIDDQDDEPVGALVTLPDVDGDGFAQATDLATVQPRCVPEALHIVYAGGAFDCDDVAALVNPDAVEVLCNGTDDDCDTQTDELDEGQQADLAYPDADGDGFPDSFDTTVFCQASAGFVRVSDVGLPLAEQLDCDPGQATIHPGATEVPYDTIDQDCSGADLLDVDGDGVAHPIDCDDLVASTFPGAPDDPGDAVDADCDGAISVTCHPDADGDGYGDGLELHDLAACPVGQSAASGDCDDGDPTIHPLAEEREVGLDADCDLIPAILCHLDADGDGFGVEPVLRDAAACPAGEAALSGDCDDQAPGTRPGAEEFCDGFDADCTPDEPAGLVSLRGDDGIWWNAPQGPIDASAAVEVAICGRGAEPVPVAIDTGDLTGRSLWVHGTDVSDDVQLASLDGLLPVLDAHFGLDGELRVGDLVLTGPGASIRLDGDIETTGLARFEQVGWLGATAPTLLDGANFAGDLQLDRVHANQSAGRWLVASGPVDAVDVDVREHTGGLFTLEDATFRALNAVDVSTTALEPVAAIFGQVTLVSSRISDVTATNDLIVIDREGSLSLLDSDVDQVQARHVVYAQGSFTASDAKLTLLTSIRTPISIRPGGVGILVRSQIRQCRGADAGAMDVLGTAIVQDTLFDSNSSLGAGGAVRVLGGQWISLASSFYFNQATTLGGGLAMFDGTATASGGTVFYGNGAVTAGGGIWMDGNSVLLASDTLAFDSNSAESAECLFTAGNAEIDALAVRNQGRQALVVAGGTTEITSWEHMFGGTTAALVSGGLLGVSDYCQLGAGAAFTPQNGTSFDAVAVRDVVSGCPTYGYGTDYGQATDIYARIECDAMSCACVTGCAIPYGYGGYGYGLP